MSDQVHLRSGSSIGGYNVVSHLASGGMGEVYVAEDQRLHRKVALKVLPMASAGNEDQRLRFLREARAASQLNHPNIVTVHELGSTAEGLDFIVMELVDGESLRKILTRGRLPLRRTLEIGAQVAAALEAAHAANIVHRDIKPENIVVSTSGVAKVLDYGLAKWTEPILREGEQDSTTFAFPAGRTQPGTVLGTVAYMSPEQAEGHDVDFRTDIFSLGVVLYEMLTGRKPFEGKSVADQLYKIINLDPPPALELNSELPAPVVDAVSKAMSKDRAERYQHAGDLRIDLRRAASASAAIAAGRRKLPWFTIAAALLAGLVIGGSLGYFTFPKGSRTSTPPDIRMTPVTTDAGYEGEPALSPDGKTLAYVSDRTGNLEIYLRQVSGGSDINITNDPADDAQPAYSPDGKEIAFVSARGAARGLVYRGPDSPMTGGDIWVAPVFGGVGRRVVAGGNFPSWSPDGSSLIFCAGSWRNVKIYTVPAVGGMPREVPVRFDRKHLYLYYPSFSRDGRWIVFQAANDLIYVVDARGGTPKLVTRGRAPAWSDASKSIIFATNEEGRNYSLWELPFSGKSGEASGSARPLTVGRGRDMNASPSRDGRLVAFSALSAAFNIERIAFDAREGRTIGSPVPVTSGLRMSYFLDLARDSQSVVFESGAYIWRVDRDGTPVQLTSDARFSDRHPEWSPDGQTIAFHRSPRGENRGEIFLMNADGTNPRGLVPIEGAFMTWTPDGKGIALFSGKDEQVSLYDLASRSLRRLTHEPAVRSMQAFSQDGQWLVYTVIGTSGTADMHAVRTDGTGSPIVVVATEHEEGHPFLDDDGRWLYFQYDHKNIYRVPGPAQGWKHTAPQKVTNFPESNLYIDDPEMSADQRSIFYSRGNFASDIWLLRLPER